MSETPGETTTTETIEGAKEPAAEANGRAMAEAIRASRGKSAKSAEPAATKPAAAEPAQPAEEPKSEPSSPEGEQAKDPGRLIAEARKERARAEKAMRKAAHERAELDAARAELDALRTLKDSDPWAFLSKLGIDARTYADKLIGEQEIDPRDKAIQELRAEIAQLKNHTDERETEVMQARAQHAAENAKASLLDDFKDAAAFNENGDSENYPYLAAYYNEDPADVANTFWQVIYSHWTETKEQLEPKEVFDFIEKRLSSQAERLAPVISRKASAPIVGDGHPKPAVNPPADKTAKREEPKAITNAVATRRETARRETRQERMERAINAFQIAQTANRNP